MAINLSSSAPHIFPAAAWDTTDGGSASAFTRDSQSRVVGLVLHRDPAGALELGVRRWHPEVLRERCKSIRITETEIGGVFCLRLRLMRRVSQGNYRGTPKRSWEYGSVTILGHLRLLHCIVEFG